MILPSNFTIEKFGLYARFVEEADAEYILQLRLSEHAKYLSPVPDDVELQRAWIREYKKREALGEDYYFIFSTISNQNIPIGLNRIYDIRKDGKFSTGSWIFGSNAPFGAAFLAEVICRDLAFGDLGLNYEYVEKGVNIKNTNVFRYDLMVGMKDVGRFFCEDGEFISLGLNKEDFQEGRKKILKMLRITEK